LVRGAPLVSVSYRTRYGHAKTLKAWREWGMGRGPTHPFLGE